MRRFRGIPIILTALGLNACAAAPAGWDAARDSVRAASDAMALHLKCVGGGLEDLTVGTFEVGLEGAAIGLAVAGDSIGGGADPGTALAILGTGGAVGGTIGLGAGLGGGVLRLPTTYRACLRANEPLFEDPPATQEG